MSREYYLHPRQSGIYYVQFVDKVSGKLLTAQSTGETDYRKAELKAELWLLNGIPTGKTKKPRSLEALFLLSSFWKTFGNMTNRNTYETKFLTVTALAAIMLISVKCGLCRR